MNYILIREPSILNQHWHTQSIYISFTSNNQERNQEKLTTIQQSSPLSKPRIPSANMFFNKRLITLFIGLLALFVSLITAAPTDSEFNERQSKSQLLARNNPRIEAFQDVTYQSMGGIPINLYTKRLVTCIGIGITGDGHKDTRFLLHVSASRSMVDAQWPNLEDGVKGADLKNMQTYIGAPDGCNADWDLEPEVKTQNDNIVEYVKSKLHALTNTDPRVFDRPMHLHPREPQGTMEIDAEKNVFVDGHPFP